MHHFSTTQLALPLNALDPCLLCAIALIPIRVRVSTVNDAPDTSSTLNNTYSTLVAALVVARVAARTPFTPRAVANIAGRLHGNTITLQTKTGAHYGGVVMSTGSEGDTTGATLKNIKDIDHRQSVASTAIDEWSSGPATVACVPDIFLTDTDISAKKNSGHERELQAWQPSGGEGRGEELLTPSVLGPKAPGLPSALAHLATQVGTNSRRTRNRLADRRRREHPAKLDRSGGGGWWGRHFKERERAAQCIADKIHGVAELNSKAPKLALNDAMPPLQADAPAFKSSETGIFGEKDPFPPSLPTSSRSPPASQPSTKLVNASRCDARGVADR
ncbi:hypothetical protein K523DRAFT_419257 [Schizophyllum commune Tattone D]|nr:hypothetical protein K523DRAFT_419257 [Schizophyllum commune Tattone D]